MAYVNVHVSRRLKAELGWTIDKRLQLMYYKYHIAGKFGRKKVWRIDSVRAFGERKFGELIDQPIDYCIYPNKSRAHINAWARINAGVQHSKVNRHLYKMQKGLV